MKTRWNSLLEWDRALAWMEYAIRQHSLDSRQTDLAWLLRFSDNWRLREAALKAVRHLNEPSAILMDEVIRIVEDESLYSGVRMLAVQALVDLLADRPSTGIPAKCRKAIIASLRWVAAESHPPVLVEAAREALGTIGAPPASASPEYTKQVVPSKRETVHGVIQSADDGSAVAHRRPESRGSARPGRMRARTHRR